MRCNGVRALVVDDESMNLVVAKSIFSRYGMELTTATSGQESIDICREKVFDIIFMDHMMSGMDGVEAMKRIRTDVSGLNVSIPIVALTANAMSSAKQMFLAEGFDGFVSKPVETEELERVLKAVLPKKSISYDDGAEAEEDNAPYEEEPATVKTAEPETDPMDKLYAAGINTAAGLKYCVDDEEFYKSLLIQFASESAEKIESMKAYYGKKDWHNYEILVHALKSTSKMIGAVDLSEEAKALEMAAKATDEEFITANHEQALMDYGRICGEIKALFMDIPAKEDDDEVLEFEPEDDTAKGGDMA